MRHPLNVGAYWSAVLAMLAFAVSGGALSGLIPPHVFGWVAFAYGAAQAATTGYFFHRARSTVVMPATSAPPGRGG